MKKTSLILILIIITSQAFCGWVTLTLRKMELKEKIETDVTENLEINKKIDEKGIDWIQYQYYIKEKNNNNKTEERTLQEELEAKREELEAMDEAIKSDVISSPIRLKFRSNNIDYENLDIYNLANSKNNELNIMFKELLKNTNLSSNYNINSYLYSTIRDEKKVDEIILAISYELLENKFRKDSNVYYYIMQNLELLKVIKNKYLYDDYEKINQYLENKFENRLFSQPNDVVVFGTNKEFSSYKALNNDLPYKPCEYDKNKKITGLVIKVDRKLKLSNCLCPKIRISNGNIIYSPSMWIQDEKNKKLIFNEISDFTYTVDFEKNLSEQDKKGNPLIVYAINLAGSRDNYTDIVISDKDAYLVQQYYFYLLKNHIFNNQVVNNAKSESKFVHVNNKHTWDFKVDNPNLFAEPGKMQNLSLNIIDVNLGGG